MRRGTFLSVVAALFASARAHRGMWGGDSSLESAVDEIAAAALRERPLPGLSVAVARGGRMMLAKGYGFAKVPAAPEIVYHLGSVSKQFTAALSSVRAVTVSSHGKTLMRYA